MFSKAVVLAGLILASSIALRGTQATQIPAGPSVRVSDGWYHLDDCDIAVGRDAPSMPLADALRKGFRPCPICEPLAHQADWAEFVKTNGDAIKAEVKARAEAEAAEARRKAEAEEADRLRRLKELEDARKKMESAPVVRLMEAQLRAIAQAAFAESNNDPAVFQTRFRARVKELSPDYSGPQTVYGSGALRIVAAGPVARFETAVMERVANRQSIAGAVWSGDVAIIVSPATEEAPDVKQIVVQRSDALRPAGAETTATMLTNTLAPHRLPGSATNSRAISMGEVTFPMSAFEPGDGVIVRVIAVPASGAPLSRTFQGQALRLIQ